MVAPPRRGAIPFIARMGRCGAAIREQTAKRRAGLPHAVPVCLKVNRCAGRSILMAVLLVGPGLEGLETEIALESLRYSDAPLVPRLCEIFVLIGIVEAD